MSAHFASGFILKRLGKDTYSKIIDKENLLLAHKNASKGKAHYKGVLLVNENIDYHIDKLHHMLSNNKFTTGEYKIVEREEGGKLRELSVLPYFPDRIVQHAIIQVVGERLESSLIRDTFQSILGRGTSDARRRVVRGIKKHKPTHYLQMDIKKYYPSIDNQKLKIVLRRFIKCEDTLNLLYNIVDSKEGLPIGNYTSQLLGNIYLSSVDWYIKQELGVKCYYRYCDDLVVLSHSGEELHKIREKVVSAVRDLGLTVKPSWTVSKLSKGLDFVGYKFFPSGIKLRSSIYKKAKRCNPEARPSYYGWLLPTKYNQLRSFYAYTLFREKT